MVLSLIFIFLFIYLLSWNNNYFNILSLLLNDVLVTSLNLTSGTNTQSIDQEKEQIGDSEEVAEKQIPKKFINHIVWNYFSQIHIFYKRIFNSLFLLAAGWYSS